MDSGMTTTAQQDGWVKLIAPCQSLHTLHNCTVGKNPHDTQRGRLPARLDIQPLVWFGWGGVQRLRWWVCTIFSGDRISFESRWGGSLVWYCVQGKKEREREKGSLIKTQADELGSCGLTFYDIFLMIFHDG